MREACMLHCRVIVRALAWVVEMATKEMRGKLRPV